MAEPNPPAKVIVLLNAAAGSLLGRDVREVRETLSRAFEQRNITATLEFPSGEQLADSARQAAHLARRGDIDAVIAGGGDGTIRTVASMLAGTSIPLGVLPFGTFNHFAKDLGIPLDIERAVATIAGGFVRAVDMGEVNGEIFLNNSSIGLYPDMVADRDRQRKNTGLPKRLAMIFAALKMLWRFQRHHFSISVDGVTEPCRTPCVFVGNNEYSFNLAELGMRHRMNTGALFLYVAESRSRVGFVVLAFRAILGRLDAARDFRMLHGRAARIASRSGHLLVAMDGEVKRMRPPLDYRERGRALHVFVPASKNAP